MSTTTTPVKAVSGKPAQEEPKVTAQTVTTTAEDEEVEPDERDRAELEAARQQDTQAAQNGGTVAEPEVPEEPEVEPEEIVALRAAFQRVQDRITEHEEQIEDHKKQISDHEEQIEDLKAMLRSRFSGLVGEISGGRKPNPPGRKPGGQQGARQRVNYGGGNSTGDLIAACLQKAKRPVNTETLVKYLEDANNTTNPSVELSRMVKKGIVNRPSRGFYEWVGDN